MQVQGIQRNSHVSTLTRWKTLTACAALTLLATLAGCGGGGQSLIAISPSTTQTIDAGQTFGILVSVVNDSGHKGASTNLSGPGTTSVFSTGNSGTATNISYIFTAPASVAAATTSTFTATSNNTPSQKASLTININPALVITTATLPVGTVQTSYSATLASSDGTGATTWALSAGTLPTGLSIAPNGTLSGTPSAAGTFNFTLAVTDAASFPSTTTQAYTVTINPQPPTITTTTLPNGVVGTAYSQQLTYTGGGGTATFAITAGSLPAASGLTLSAAGLISGTPATAAAGQVYNFSVTVTTGTQTSAAVPFTLTIDALPAVTTTTLPSGNIGIAYSQRLATSGGNGGPATWAITAGSLPAGSGLTLSTSGLISGTPTTATTYSFSVAVTIGGQTSPAQALTLTINSLIVTSSTTATGEVNLPFSFHLTAAGGTGPYTWSLATGSTALPSGFTLNATTGVITATPSTTTGSPFTGIVFQVTDSLSATATQGLTITVNPARTNANNSELNGQYAFLLTGFDATGRPLALAGKFTADGAGNIASGIVDTNGTSLSAAATNATINASTYAVSADNRGKVTLTTAAGSETFVFALNAITSGIAAGGTLTEFDATGQSLTGTFALQTPAVFTTASITSGFAYGLSGYALGTTTTLPQRRAMVGELQFNGTGGITSGELLSSASSTTTPTVPTSATLAIASNGRGTLALTTSTGTLNFAVYIVSATRFFLLSTDPAGTIGGTHDLLSGQALQQTIGNGNFNAASLSGISVLRSERLGLTNTGATFPDIQLGLYTFNGTGTATFSGDENAGGTVTSNSLSGTYTVAANGRVALTLAPGGIGGCTNCVSTLPFAYLIGTNRGFLMDFHTNTLSGAFDPQTATGITNATFTGPYTLGTSTPLASNSTLESAVATSTGTGTFTATLDSNAAGTLSPDTAESGTYTTASTGRATLTVTGSQPVFYILSSTQVFLMDLSTATPILQELTHQ